VRFHSPRFYTSGLKLVQALEDICTKEEVRPQDKEGPAVCAGSSGHSLRRSRRLDGARQLVAA